MAQLISSVNTVKSLFEMVTVCLGLFKVWACLKFNYLQHIVFAEVEVVMVRHGIIMVDNRRNLIQSKILSPVPSSSLKMSLCKKTSLLVGDIVLEDFWWLLPLIVAQIYFVLPF